MLNPYGFTIESMTITGRKVKIVVMFKDVYGDPPLNGEVGVSIVCGSITVKRRMSKFVRSGKLVIEFMLPQQSKTNGQRHLAKMSPHWLGGACLYLNIGVLAPTQA